MPRFVNPRDKGTAAASKRVKKSTGVTHVAATGVFTVAAGWLNDLSPNDVVRFSSLTGGSGVSTSIDFYIAGPRWNAGATTFRVSTRPDGPILVGGSNISAGTVSTGDLTFADDGVLSGNYVSPDSPAGR